MIHFRTNKKFDPFVQTVCVQLVVPVDYINVRGNPQTTMVTMYATSKALLRKNYLKSDWIWPNPVVRTLVCKITRQLILKGVASETRVPRGNLRCQDPSRLAMPLLEGGGVVV